MTDRGLQIVDASVSWLADQAYPAIRCVAACP
jgi:hypothetical protein